MPSIEGELRKLGGAFERLDIERRFKKTELDSKRSLYDGMIDRGEESQARSYLTTVVAQTEGELDSLSKKLEAAKSAQKAKLDDKEKLLGYVDDLTKEKERLTREADRVARVIEQKDALHGGPLHWYSEPMAFLRSLPGIDIMPPTKIQQISLPDLTINYNFKEVPRYDRCATCHQGIDRIGYDKDATGKPMARAYRSHPFLTSGATTVDPRGKVVSAGLYLDANGPHPINSFGCTICHGGQGSGTDFTFASHTPDSLDGRPAEWHKEYGWQDFHYWDFPMPPNRCLESNCLKCHQQVTDIPQATKLQAGYQRIVKYGCTGCHAIGGDGSTGPDLTGERQVGPNLAHIASKNSKEWVQKWIANPHAFRPDSRMPRFYGLTNNNGKEDWPKNYAEIHAITHYLYAKSTAPADFVDPPAHDRPGEKRERSCSFRKDASRATSIGLMPAATSSRPTEDPPTLITSPRSRVPDLRSQELSRRGSGLCPGGFRPEPVQHFRQVPVAAARLEVAVQLDSSPGAIPPQELDAQLAARAARRSRHRELDPLGTRRVAGQGRGAGSRIPGSHHRRR